MLDAFWGKEFEYSSYSLTTAHTYLKYIDNKIWQFFDGGEINGPSVKSTSKLSAYTES